jgi:cell division protein FtsW
MKKYKGYIDWWVLLPVAALMLFSIAFVFSASASFADLRFGSYDKFFYSHAFRIFLAFIALMIFSRIDYHFWGKFSKIFIFISVIFLVLLFIIGTPINYVYRWLYIGPINFQPSEIAKFALVLHFARLLAERQEYIKDFKIGMLPLIIWSLIICGLIALQPNFSTALVVYLIAISMMFIGNTNFLHLIFVGIISFVGAIIYALSASYRRARIMSFLGYEETDINEDAVRYQIDQAIIAIGNGGFFGVGPGHSRQSQLYLPESYGDFIFSIIGEEYGFIGLFIIILLFILILWRGIRIAKMAPDLFGYFLSTGILLTIAYYTIVSAAVNVGLLPTTGLPIPFLSYGGTAVIIYASAIGILLNISAQAGVLPKRQNIPPPET